MILVPLVPAHGCGPDTKDPAQYSARYAHSSSRLLDTTCTDAETKLILANASPRNPNVCMSKRSLKLRSLDVANRSQSKGKSDLLIP